MNMSKIRHRRKYICLGVAFMAIAFYGVAQGAEKAPTPKTCDAMDRPCLLDILRQSADGIDNVSWRDQTYRELAKTLAFDGQDDAAIALIDKIQTPDTQAMTIRGIGMTAAPRRLSGAARDELFTKQRARAEKIADPPSCAIALTCIAMGQAFAGDDEGSWKTAGEMKNDALRHKAFGETAEIQAERGDIAAALKSVRFIDTDSFRNKAYFNVSKIMADRKRFPDALAAAAAITNPYKRAAAIQYILDIQKPREAIADPKAAKGAAE